MPSQAAESPTKRRTDMPDTCSCCKCTLRGPRHILDKDTYPNNIIIQKILKANPMQNQYLVCTRCFNKIKQSKLIQCASCNNTYPKSKALLYAHGTDNMVTDSDGNMLVSAKITEKYFCKLCQTNQFTNVNCVCCDQCVPQQRAQQYVSTDYDFSIFVVSALLSTKTCERNDTHPVQLFICNVCKASLSKSTNINACIPIYAHNPIA